MAELSQSLATLHLNSCLHADFEQILHVPGREAFKDICSLPGSSTESINFGPGLGHIEKGREAPEIPLPDYHRLKASFPTNLHIHMYGTPNLCVISIAIWSPDRVECLFNCNSLAM